MTTSAKNPAIKRVLVVRLGAMGDVIHALPAVAALRAMFPLAVIGWAVEERWAELLTSQPRFCAAPEKAAEPPGSAPQAPLTPDKPLVDRIHLVNTRAWRAHLLAGETWKGVRQAARELRQQHYDLAVDFQGAWKSALLARASGAPLRIGFRQPRETGALAFYTHRMAACGTHIVEQNVSLVSQLGECGIGAVNGACLPLRLPSPELPLDPAQERKAAEELARRGLDGKDFAVINPGAGWDAKRWPAERYAEVARGLGACGLHSLINYGPEEEDLARAVASASEGAAQAVRCSIGELIALMRRARLFVGGDTGPMHLAAALHVPVVAIFGPTNPARNGPFATESIVLRSPASVTNHSRRAPPDVAMLAITADEVLQAARTLLARTPPHAPWEVRLG